MKPNEQTLEEVGQNLREKVQAKRNTMFRLDDDAPKKLAPQVKIKPPIQVTSTQVKDDTSQILHGLKQLEVELDELTRRPVNLSEKYGVTPKKIVALGGLMDKVSPENFEKKKFMPSLDVGMMMIVQIPDFEYFKILNICTTSKGENICVVNFKTHDGKKGQTDLVILFPLEEQGKLKIYSPKTQEFFREYTILGLSQTKKNLFMRALEALGFAK